jgi:hypothetical protein
MPAQMSREGADTDASDLMKLLQELKPLRGAVAVKGFQIGKGYPFFMPYSRVFVNMAVGNAPGLFLLLLHYLMHE